MPFATGFVKFDQFIVLPAQSDPLPMVQLRPGVDTPVYGAELVSAAES